MKKIACMLLVITLLLSIYNVTYATTLDNIIGGADGFLNAAQNSEHIGFKSDAIAQASDLIYNTLLILGVVIAVIIAAFLGIKFITSSVEEQAKVKESLIPFVIGCVIIFGAFGIWKLVTNTLEGIQTSSIITEIARK